MKKFIETVKIEKIPEKNFRLIFFKRMLVQFHYSSALVLREIVEPVIMISSFFDRRN